MIARIGDPPANPLALASWITKALAEVWRLQARGEISSELAASLRATASALDRAMPAATDAEVARLLRGDRHDTEADVVGPQPEPRNTDGRLPHSALRRDPR